MSVEKMEERTKFYRNEAIACAGIGAFGVVLGFLTSIQGISLDARPYGTGFMFLCAGILLIGPPYYLLKTLRLKRQTKKSGKIS